MVAAFTSRRPCTETYSRDLCGFKELNGRILAEDFKADRDLPPFNHVAMDGYACRRDALSSPLTISGSIAAGSVPDLYVEPGTCIKVMTGAVLPNGADLIVMVESTAIGASGRMVARGCDRERRTNNFSRQGEDVHAGQQEMSDIPRPFKVRVLTVSDRAYAGRCADLSGLRVAELFGEH